MNIIIYFDYIITNVDAHIYFKYLK